MQDNADNIRTAAAAVELDHQGAAHTAEHTAEKAGQQRILRICWQIITQEYQQIGLQGNGKDSIYEKAQAQLVPAPYQQRYIKDGHENAHRDGGNKMVDDGGNAPQTSCNHIIGRDKNKVA